MERRELGFTLIEVVIGVAIVAMTAAAGVAISLASRPTAVSAAAARFDALLDAARTEAREFDSGVTIAFTRLEPNPAIDGFRARLYRNRPALGSLTALNLPGIDAAVALKESETLGTPSFALTIHADGRVNGIVGYAPAAQSSSPETGCPASGAYHFVFSAAGGHADRYVPCRFALAASGPVAYATRPPAGGGGAPPTPNGCNGGPCSSAPPAQTSTCPPTSFLSGTQCIESPLVVNPRSIVLLHPNGPSRTITASEASYYGPISITSTTCDSAVTLDGGGKGPGASFSVGSSKPEMCNLVIADDHGGSQTVYLTTYGVLTVSPTSLVFKSPSAPTQGIMAHEEFYPGVISTDLTTPDAAGNPGCVSYASVDSTGRNTDSSWNAGFSLSPRGAVLQCAVTLHDDHGGVAQTAVEINNPTTTCPDGTVVGLGIPCPARVVASAGLRMSLTAYCKLTSSGVYTPGVNTLDVDDPSRQSYTLSATEPELFVSVTTMTLSNANPVTFAGSAPAGSTASLAVSSTGTQPYTATSPFVGPGSWSGNVWTPPSAGTYYVGYVQDWQTADCNSGGGGQQGGALAYSGGFSFTATQ